MKKVDEEKANKIVGIMASLQQPFEYVMGATLVLAQEQCFHFDIRFDSYLNIYGEYTKICKCNDCGKVLDKNELKRFMI